MAEEGIRIDQLPAEASPTFSHEFPVMLGGFAYRLNIQQVSTLVQAILVDAAPLTLDTLNELAAALGDDPNFATTVSTALGNRIRADASQSFSTSEKMQARENAGAIGNIFKRTFTSTSGTHNFDSETKVALIEVIGGGGGGGAVPTTGGGNNCNVSGGGGSGGYCARLITLGGITSGTMTIGAGGASNSNGGNSIWSDGTNTLTANGGSAGSAGVSGANMYYADGGAGGSGSGGDNIRPGKRGGEGFYTSNGVSSGIMSLKSGSGADSPIGGGGGAQKNITGGIANASANGNAASSGGAGGGGAYVGSGGAAAIGGAGAAGVIIITEYK